MPHLLKLLKGLIRGSASVEPGKLGSDGDPIRQMLFGSQCLQEQVQRMRLNGCPGPLQTIADGVADGSADSCVGAVGAVRWF
jgi:hypothetical protein